MESGALILRFSKVEFNVGPILSRTHSCKESSENLRAKKKNTSKE